MKKILSVLCLSLSLSGVSFAADYVAPKDSVEYHIHNENLFTFKVNDIYNEKPLDVINYLGEEWLVGADDGSATYYLQVDPIYKTISRVRVVYPFDQVRMGKEIKFLDDKYGQVRETGAKYLIIEEDTLRVRISTDFDNLGEDFDRMYSIFDFIETKTSSKRKESINHIYYEERMIRK